MDQTQIVYAKPPADGALPDPEGTFFVHTPFDAEATSLEAGEVLVENEYLAIEAPTRRCVTSSTSSASMPRSTTERRPHSRTL